MHAKGSQVQLKLKRIYYMGLLHPTAKIGATGFGNSVPLSLPDRDRAEEPKPGAIGIMEAFNRPNFSPFFIDHQ
jgi:hypothetical protein